MALVKRSQLPAILIGGGGPAADRTGRREADIAECYKGSDWWLRAGETPDVMPTSKS